MQSKKQVGFSRKIPIQKSNILNKIHITPSIKQLPYDELSKENKALVDEIVNSYSTPRTYQVLGFEKEREADLLKLKNSIAKDLGLIK